jgi:hypothetical protein
MDWTVYSDRKNTSKLQPHQMRRIDRQHQRRSSTTKKTIPVLFLSKGGRGPISAHGARAIRKSNPGTATSRMLRWTWKSIHNDIEVLQMRKSGYFIKNRLVDMDVQICSRPQMLQPKAGSVGHWKLKYLSQYFECIWLFHTIHGHSRFVFWS